MVDFARINCPHCHTKAAAITVIATKDKGEFNYVRCDKHGTEYKNVSLIIYQCNQCGEGLISSTLIDYDGIPKNGSELIYPRPPSINAPYGTPERIDRVFMEAISNLKGHRYESAGVMFRKVIDLATKGICEKNEKNKTLNMRINSLAERNAITEELKDLAHLVRVEGNDASHDEEEFTKEDAEALHQFSELFLTYIYTLPQKILEAKQGVEEATDR